jgi:hypothetical protein
VQPQVHHLTQVPKQGKNRHNNTGQCTSARV